MDLQSKFIPAEDLGEMSWQFYDNYAANSANLFINDVIFNSSQHCYKCHPMTLSKEHLLCCTHESASC